MPQLHSTDAFFAAVLERVKAVAQNDVIAAEI